MKGTNETCDLSGEILEVPSDTDLTLSQYKELINDFEFSVSKNHQLQTDVQILQTAATKHLNIQCDLMYELHETKEALRVARGNIRQLQYEMNNLRLDLSEKAKEFNETLAQLKGKGD